MKYKVGDKVRIKTWGELVTEFGLFKEYINFSNNLWWTQYMDSNIPSNRIVTITEIDDDGDYIIDGYVICKEMIKEAVTENTDLFQKYFDRGLTYYGTLTSDPEKIAKQANKYAEECIKYVRL